MCWSLHLRQRSDRTTSCDATQTKWTDTATFVSCLATDEGHLVQAGGWEVQQVGAVPDGQWGADMNDRKPEWRSKQPKPLCYIRYTYWINNMKIKEVTQQQAFETQGKIDYVKKKRKTFWRAKQRQHELYAVYGTQYNKLDKFWSWCQTIIIG